MIFYLVTIYHERQFQIMFTIDELKPLGFQATFWMERLLCDLQGEFIQPDYDDYYDAKNLHLSNGKDVLSCISLKCFAHLKKKADHTIYFLSGRSRAQGEL